jgi:hypothetical protein
MIKTHDKKLYENKEKKVFFRNDEERNLWIRLNAEHIRYCKKVVNRIDKPDLGSIDEPHTHMWVSNNQLVYDEFMEDAPRMSLAELSAMSQDELVILAEKRNEETIKKIFKDTLLDDNFMILDDLS